MKPDNAKFYALLRELKSGDPSKPYTLDVLANAIGANRDCVNRTVNKAAPRPGQFGNVGAGLRVRIAAHFTSQFPDRAKLLLSALGWDENGNLVEQNGNVPRRNRYISQT